MKLLRRQEVWRDKRWKKPTQMDARSRQVDVQLDFSEHTLVLKCKFDLEVLFHSVFNLLKAFPSPLSSRSLKANCGRFVRHSAARAAPPSPDDTGRVATSRRAAATFPSRKNSGVLVRQNNTVKKERPHTHAHTHDKNVLLFLLKENQPETWLG